MGEFLAEGERSGGMGYPDHFFTRPMICLELFAIVKKRLGSEASLYTILQILSLTLFEKTSIDQLLANMDHESEESDMPKQLDLFT